MSFLKQNTAIAVPVGPFVNFSDGKTLLTDNDAFDPTDIVCECIKADGNSSELTLTKTGGANNINLTGKGQATLVLAAGNVDTAGSLRLSFTNAIKNGYSTEIVLPFVEDFEIIEITLKEYTEADAYIDKTATPWQKVIHKKGDANTEYSRKNLYDINNGPLTSETQIIGSEREPSV